LARGAGADSPRGGPHGGKKRGKVI